MLGITHHLCVPNANSKDSSCSKIYETKGAIFILETHMNAAIKADILKCCQAIEKDGLSYEQYGQVIKHSKHFDFGPFIKALEQYVVGYDRWLTTSDLKEIESDWVMVGQAQRDVPVHVAHEYCRIDRAFHPTPTFVEAYLPENLTIFNYNRTYANLVNIAYISVVYILRKKTLGSVNGYISG